MYFYTTIEIMNSYGHLLGIMQFTGHTWISIFLVLT